MEVKIKLKEGAILPTKGSENAMCWDCYAHAITINEFGKIEVDLGFSIEPPKGYGVRLIPRSNLTKYWWVLNNSIGIGDEDYRGSYKAIFTPLFINHSFPYQLKDRACQLEIYKRDDFEWKVVSELSETERGNGGFGSTGLT